METDTSVTGSNKHNFYTELIRNTEIGENQHIRFNMFGYKLSIAYDDTAMLMRRSLTYVQSCMGAFYAGLANNWDEFKDFANGKDSRAFATAFEYRFKKLFSGPGTAYFILSSDDRKTLLHSDVGWEQLKVLNNLPFEDFDRDDLKLQGNYLVRTPDFNIDMIICDDFYRGCSAKRMMDVVGRCSPTCNECLKCRENKKITSKKFSSSSLPGLTLETFSTLRSIAIQQIREMTDVFDLLVQRYLGEPDGLIKAPDWDLDHAGTYIIPSDIPVDEINKGWWKPLAVKKYGSVDKFLNPDLEMKYFPEGSDYYKDENGLVKRHSEDKKHEEGEKADELQ